MDDDTDESVEAVNEVSDVEVEPVDDELDKEEAVVEDELEKVEADELDEVVVVPLEDDLHVVVLAGFRFSSIFSNQGYGKDCHGIIWLPQLLYFTSLCSIAICFISNTLDLVSVSAESAAGRLSRLAEMRISEAILLGRINGRCFVVTLHCRIFWLTLSHTAHAQRSSSISLYRCF